jgi:hypothetical protein
MYVLPAVLEPLYRRVARAEIATTSK